MSPAWKMPALEKKTSTRPKRFSASCTRFLMSPSFETSHGTVTPSGVESIFRKPIPPRTSPAAPSCLKRRAAAGPMPLAPPVMTATLPFRSTRSDRSSYGDRISEAGLLADLLLGNRVAVHFVRAIGEAQRAGRGVGAREAELLRDAAAAVHLHRPVDHLAGHGGREHLDHGDFLACILVADGVHLPRRVQDHEARRVDHDARLGNALARHALLGDGAAEGDASGGAL